MIITIVWQGGKLHFSRILRTWNAHISIRFKLFLSHILAVLLVSGSIGTYFYTSAAESLLTGLQERLQSSAALISQTIAGLLVAEKIRDRIGESLFYAGGTAVQVTASFGLAEYDADSEVKRAGNEADEALFLAKNKGRNRIELAGGRSC